MNSSVKCSILFALCLVLISQSPMPTNAKHHKNNEKDGGDGVGLLAQICKDTAQDNLICMNLLSAQPKIIQAKNFRELSKEILEFALEKGMEAQNVLKGIAQTNNVPEIVQCANFHYDGVVASFRSSLLELKDDPQTANYDAKVAGDGLDCCERGLTNAHIVNPVISTLNKQILLLSNIAFQATSRLH